MASSVTKWRRPPRDLKMVYAGMLCGGLTAEHFSRLFFPKAVVHGKVAVHSNCQLRLKLLRQDGLLERIEQYQTPKEGKRPYLYRPTKRGVQAIADWLGCDSQDLSYRQKDSRLSSTYARHLIGENDLRVAILCGVRDTPGVKLPTWLDSVTLKATHGADKMTVRGPHGGTQTAVLIPDGYFELQLSQPYERMFRHFVEIDMGTETGEDSYDADGTWRKTWARKIVLYVKYLEGGQQSLMYRRYGSFRARVLSVTTSEQRLENLVRVTEKVGGRQRFWFSTFDRLKSVENVLAAPIWTIADPAVHERKTLIGMAQEPGEG